MANAFGRHDHHLLATFDYYYYQLVVDSEDAQKKVVGRDISRWGCPWSVIVCCMYLVHDNGKSHPWAARSFYLCKFIWV